MIGYHVQSGGVIYFELLLMVNKTKQKYQYTSFLWFKSLKLSQNLSTLICSKSKIVISF